MFIHEQDEEIWLVKKLQMHECSINYSGATSISENVFF